LAEEIKPSFIFLENVPAIRTRGLERVVEELSAARYDCRWGVISAFDVGAPHKRERWFLLANTNSTHGERKRIPSGGDKKDKDDGFSIRWPVEPDMDRVANGVPCAMDRLKCLGNAVVPLQAKEAFERLMGLK
jgi:DNA (cytosine-5)-methyltransferase 1